MKRAKATPQAKSGPNQRASGWWSLREGRAGPGLEAAGSTALEPEHAGLPLKGQASVCPVPAPSAWHGRVPSPSPPPAQVPGRGVLHVCWRLGQGRLASSKGPAVPKPTHPAAASPEGPAPRDPLRGTPSQTLLEAVLRSLLPTAGAPSPHFLQKDLDTSLPLGLQLPPHVHPASNWQPHSFLPSQMKAPLLNTHRSEALGDPRHNHTHPMPLPNPFRPRVIWAMDKVTL